MFDFDGVLVDSNAIKRETYFEVFAALGDTRDAVTSGLAACPLGDRYQVIDHILGQLNDRGVDTGGGSFVERRARYAERYSQICEVRTSTCAEVAGACRSLSRLSRRYALYVNSATPEAPLRRVIERRGWAGYFRGVLGGPRSKTENVRSILHQEQVDGRDAVFVGDGQRDLAAAQAGGCRFVGIRNDTNDFDPRGLIMLDDLCGLEDVIRTHWETAR